MPEQVPKFYKNPAISTILSFFWPGFGQIYNGEIGKGIAFIAAYGLSIVLIFAMIGVVTTPIVWIWGMVDANKSANRINRQIASQ